MLKQFLMSSVALAALCSPVLAEDKAETVIITATRIATPQSQIASAVTVVTAADIETRQLTSLPDVLRDVPGLNVVRTGGQGGQTSLFTRGTNSNHTKILVDGIDIADNSTPNGAYDLGKLNAADFAQVEILRGPGSGLYGSDAIGGVINIITKSGEGDPSLLVHAEGGSFDTFNQNASFGGSSDQFHYRFTLAHQHAGDTPVTPPALLPKGQSANGDFYDSLSASAKLAYDVTDYFTLGFVGRTGNSLAKYTTDGFSFVTFTGVPSKTQARAVTIQNDGRITAHLVLGLLDQTIGLAYSSGITAVADPANGPGRYSGERVKLDWQGVVSLGDGHTLVLGAENTRDAIHAPVSAGITTTAGYAELQSSIGAFDSAASIRLDDNSRYGSKFTWRVAPMFRIDASGTRLKASAGAGFKAPPLQSLFGPFSHNPNLKPETSTGYDVGFDQALGTALSGGATWFHNDLDNLIGFGPPPTFAPVNVDRARAQGVEAYLAWTATETLTLRADYTYTEAKNAVTHLNLPRRPTNKAGVNAAWQATPALTLDAALLHVSGGHDFDRLGFFTVKSQSYVTADISAAYAISDMFSIYGRINNLADADYQEPNGFLQPGQAFYAGIKATL